MQQGKDKVLFLYTTDFPYDYGESFLETELPYLVRHFKKVLIIPFNPKQERRRELPEGAELHEIPKGKPSSYGLKAFLSKLPLIFRILKAEASNGKLSYHLKRARYTKNLILHKLDEAERLDAFHREHGGSENVFYSFWFNNRVMELSLLKAQGKIGVWISKIRGHDLYPERTRLGFFPYRGFQMKHVDRVFPDSRKGERYLRKAYPRHAYKFKASHCGVEDHGMNPATGDEDYYRIVTCFNFFPIKRGPLMVRVLSHLTDMPIEWVHFGEGEEFEKVKGMANEAFQGSALCFSPQGKVGNDEIFAYFRDQPVHLLLNTSASEGLPVSMIEAISFGIPIVGTSVGGVPEIITEESGALLDPDPDPSEAAATLRDFLQRKSVDPSFRKKVRAFWSEHFNAEKNYDAFAREIHGISEE